jgi:hypothetical protein
MVLYFAPLATGIPSILLYRCSVNKDKPAILLYSDAFYRSRNINVDKLIETGIFDNVIDCDPNCGWSKSKVSVQAVKDAVVEHFDGVFTKNNIAVSDFDEIISLTDNFLMDFNLYCAIKEIRYSWLENLKNISVTLGFTEERKHTYWGQAVSESNCLTAFAPTCVPILHEESDQSKNMLNDREYSVWNPIKSVSEVSDENLMKILQLYAFSDNIESPSTLLLQNSDAKASDITDNVPRLSWLVKYGSRFRQLYSNFARNDFHSFARLNYKIALDFYQPEDSKLYIKPHPNDPLTAKECDMLFGGDLVGTVPFEFLSEHMRRKGISYDNAIVFNSIANNYLQNVVKTEICLKYDFFNCYPLYFSLYVALMFAKEGIAGDIYCNPRLTHNVRQLLKYCINSEKKVSDLPANAKFAPHSLAIVTANDFYSPERIYQLYRTLPKNVTLCFLDICDEYYFFNNSALQAFSPECFAAVSINKQRISGRSFVSLHRELLWFFSKDAKTIKSAHAFSTQKALKRTGIQIECAAPNDSFEIYKEITEKLKAKKTLKLSRTLESDTELLKSLVIPDSLERLTRMLQKADFMTYLALCGYMKSRYTILIAVRDTPGDYIDDLISERLLKLGVTKPLNKMWTTYLGVIDSNLKYETYHDDESNSAYEFMYHNHEIKLLSSAWKKDNKAEIIIDGVDYSANHRGLNFVIFDFNEGKSVDSVAFDLHEPKFTAYRK